MIEEHVSVASWRRIQQKARFGSRAKDVRGNLRGNIPNVEDTQSGVELAPSEAQIFLETTQAGSTR